MMRFISAPWTYADDKDSITLEMPAAWDPNLVASLTESVSRYLISVVTANWLAKYIGLDRAQQYADDADGLLLDINSKLYYRRRPTRTPPSTGS